MSGQDGCSYYKMFQRYSIFFFHYIHMEIIYVNCMLMQDHHGAEGYPAGGDFSNSLDMLYNFFNRVFFNRLMILRNV
jgi:hypothetical protein